MQIEYRPQRELLVAPGQIDHHVADMTATISADLPLQIAQDRLAEFDQWIPIDGKATLSVGQLVEENSTGPLRLGYGAWRDLLLGCQFKTPGGPLITAGGRTMKNVAGYDLTKFMVGQRGMLAKLCTITVRTYRRPEAALLAEFPSSDSWLGGIIATPLRPHYAVLSPDALICGWLGDERHIRLFETLAASYAPRKILRQSLEQDIQHRSELWQAEGSHFRASVPPTKILSFVMNAGLMNAPISPDDTLPSSSGIPGEDRGGGLPNVESHPHPNPPPETCGQQYRRRGKCWVADAAFGIVIGAYSAGEDTMIAQAAENAGGSVTFFTPSGPPAWRANPVEKALLEAIRNSFVPVD